MSDEPLRIHEDRGAMRERLDLLLRKNLGILRAGTSYDDLLAACRRLKSSDSPP